MAIENAKWAPVDDEDKKFQKKQAQKQAKDAEKAAKKAEKAELERADEEIFAKPDKNQKKNFKKVGKN